MAEIRNPVAFQAWLKRKQMAQQQQQQVNTMQQQGAGAVADQQLVAALLEQAAMRDIQAKAIRNRDMPLGVYNELFGKGTPIPGYNGRKSAYQDLNLGIGGNERV